MCCHQSEHWLSFTSLRFISFHLRFLTLSLWDKMQGAEELYVLLLSPNKSSSYITFAEKKPASVLQKTTSKTWRRCPSSENSDTSKMANSATQFKAGNELVPAELCQRTGRSLKTSKEMRSIQVPPSPPPSARMQQKQDPSPHPATTQLWFKREQNI